MFRIPKNIRPNADILVDGLKSHIYLLHSLPLFEASVGLSVKVAAGEGGRSQSKGNLQ